MKLHRNSILALLTVLTLGAVALAADGSFLKPPSGTRVAVVVFEDLQCPDCARWYPVIWETATAQGVPVVLHDFPLPMHNWSFEAAVYARFFDTKSQKLGDDFRGYMYKNQTAITPQSLRQWVQKFADEHKVPLPFAVDPEGKLKGLVLADRDLGNRVGLKHTPTIFVVANGGPPTPFTEIEEDQDMAQNKSKLSQAIDEMRKKAAPVAQPKPAKTKARSKKAS